MKSTLLLAILVGVCFWSTLSRSEELAKPIWREEPNECVDLAKAAAAVVQIKHGLASAETDFKADEICDQIQNIDSSVDFLSAVDASVTSLLTDGSDIESPLALTTDLAFDALDIDYTYPLPQSVKDKAVEILKEELNKPTTKIRMLSRSDAPENGESVDENWIIEVKIKSLSDHIFWVVVDRNGVNPTYNYGFN